MEKIFRCDERIPATFRKLHTMTDEQILQATLKLQHYIESENYRGYDPYDALKSPLFTWPFFKSNKFIRFASQQALKRFPVNIRPGLFIPKGTNPVTLGLCIQAYTQLIPLFPQEHAYHEKIKGLVEQLAMLIPRGFHGACWGYDFDWEARHARIPAYQPTVVATGIICNALAAYYRLTGSPEALRLCRSACDFILEDLHRTPDEEGNTCFSYSPFDTQVVFNASMKAARTLAHVYSITREEKLKSEASHAVKFVIRHQQENGSWRYSMADDGGWTDHYHTGYILECLDEYMLHTGDRSGSQNLEKGIVFYREHFFENEAVPKFYAKKTYPVDCTAAAQGLLTLCRFHDIAHAKKVAVWMIDHMQDESGYFYFRKFKFHTEKTPFMRWSNAWMFAGLSTLLGRLHS